MKFILSLVWFIRSLKAALFWLYLWQLKEYHLGRFFAHFKTAKGRQLLLNKLLFLKLTLFVGYLFLGPCLFYFSFCVSLSGSNIGQPSLISFFWLIFAIYLLEAAKAFKDFLSGQLKAPVLTKKTIFLGLIIIPLLVSLPTFLWQGLKKPYQFGNAFDLERFANSLLIVDILIPVIVSLIIILSQPLAVLWRNRLIQRAKNKRGQCKNLLVIGIAGSYGKTSTKEFLAAILAEKFKPRNTTSACAEGAKTAERAEVDIRGKVLKTKEHQNSEVGIAQCILNELKPEHQIFIAEMGAYGKGWITLLTGIVKPKIGIITGINEQHLSLFGSMANLLSAEGGEELIGGLEKDGFVIFNGNNDYCRKIYQKTAVSKKITLARYDTFSTAVENVVYDIEAREITVGKENLSFKVILKSGEEQQLKVNLVGGQNVENLLLAICCAKELGTSLEEIAAAVGKIKQEQGSMRLLKGINDIDIIDSSYSANPTGAAADINHLKLWAGKKIVVMPCLIELGPAAKEIHYQIGRLIGEICDLAIITTEDEFREIQRGAAGPAGRKANVLFLDEPLAIFEKIKTFSRPGDVILLEGRVPQKLTELLRKNK